MNCRVCGSELPEGAMFCGECGNSVTATRVRQQAVADQRPSDTTVIAPLTVSVPFPLPQAATPDVLFGDGGAPGSRSAAAPIVEVPDFVTVPPPVMPPSVEPEPEPEPVLEMVPEVVPAPRSNAEPGPLPESPVHAAVPVAPVPVPVPAAEAAPVVHNPVVEAPAVEARATTPPSVIAEAIPALSFTFSFSTGESITVTGNGLIGRRPAAQPGESFDRVIPIADHGRSVSKTHLEYGQEAGELWICDRYSGNGTVIRPKNGQPRLCEPGRRYRVERGSRIEIGEQLFDVR